MNMQGDYRYVAPEYMQTAKAFDVPYSTLYDKNTVFGRWLRSKNLIEKIGDRVYLHGACQREGWNGASQIVLTPSESR